MRVLMSGASGFLGTALSHHLAAHGHEVTRLVRRPVQAPDESRWDPYAEVIDLGTPDAVVNLSGAGVGDRRWTRAYKHTIRDSRVEPTAVLSRAIAAAPVKPRVMLSASGIGFYGDTGDAVVTEDSPLGEGFLQEVCRAWESATRPAEDAGVRVAHLRTGLVLSGAGGLLPRMLPLFRAGVGGRLGTGRQYMPWITLADWLGAATFLLDSAVHGPVNMVGPAPVTNAEFTRELASALRRPAVLPAPSVGLRLVLGEFSSEVLTGQRAVPAALTAAGYTFEHTTLPVALHWALGDS
ncbi:TIGR01777 family oxidoreductase [Longispora sp. K20-0274]|uniref:TIGR01777 family oxidoreductase n=1 Tax=Longispora sp. K20-0274 TaxID=3088255 RepID=UPI00399A66BD